MMPLATSFFSPRSLDGNRCLSILCRHKNEAVQRKYILLLIFQKKAFCFWPLWLFCGDIWSKVERRYVKAEHHQEHWFLAIELSQLAFLLIVLKYCRGFHSLVCHMHRLLLSPCRGRSMVLESCTIWVLFLLQTFFFVTAPWLYSMLEQGRGSVVMMGGRMEA
jgi:hypothetical protein